MPAFVKFVNGKLYGGGRALSTNLGTTEVLSSGSTVAGGYAKSATATMLSLPGVTYTTVGAGTFAMVAGRRYYMPLLVRGGESIALDQLVAGVGTAAAAGKVLRAGLYEANKLWQPGALLEDGGTKAADSTGTKTWTVAETLTPGRYLLSLESDGTPTMYVIGGFVDGGILNPTINTNPFITQLYKDGVVATDALPAEGADWDTVNDNQYGLVYFLRVRRSDPT